MTLETSLLPQVVLEGVVLEIYQEALAQEQPELLIKVLLVVMVMVIMLAQIGVEVVVEELQRQALMVVVQVAEQVELEEMV
jgi:uncharacterized membrane protein